MGFSKIFTSKNILLILLTFLFVPFSLAQTTVEYTSQVDTDNHSIRGVGVGIQNFGPYTAHGLVWVFLNNGTGAIWRTKQAEPGGEWSEKQDLFALDSGYNKFSVNFDGTYFHFVRNDEGDLRYMRGKAEQDGSITLDEEILIYSDPIWDVQSTDLFSIEIDYRGLPWVVVSVKSGNDNKAVILSSISNSSGWVDRPGWPKDLVSPNSQEFHGQGPQVLEIAEGKILFAARDYPSRRMGARLWTEAPGDPDGEGNLGSLEITPLIMESARTSMVSPSENIAILNVDNNLARRNADGTWITVTPSGLSQVFWNSMSVKNGAIRIWDHDGSNIRYRESPDGGDTWGTITNIAASGIVQIAASPAVGSHGDHHSVLWMTNSSGDPFDPPYDVFMRIEGIVPEPTPPLLVSPPDGTDDLPDEFELKWRSVNNAHSYDVQVSKESDFSTTVIDQSGIMDTTLVISEIELNHIYYWRVRSITPGGTIGDWSEAWQFETVGIPPIPVLSSPSDGAENQPTAITFSWEEATGAETYQLQIATVTDFSATFYDQSNITGTERFVDGFDKDNIYYWRVRAINEFGEGDWSEVWSFSTGSGVPASPVLSLPENESIDQPVTLTFEWDSVNIADTYRLQVSKVSDFSSTVVNIGGITDTSYEASGLEHSQTYYWRVNASNVTGTSGWSQVWNFTTIIEKPEVPVLVTPADQEDDVSTKPFLDWEQADRAETYSIQLASDADFSEMILEESELDTTSLQVIQEIEEFSTFYWRVNATNIGGTSDWSDVWQFTTGEAFPVPPELVSPADGATELDTDITLLWSAVQRASSYRIQVSEFEDFSETVYDNDGITNTFFNASNLEGGTEYFWRVRGVSGRGAGDWSEVWSFITYDVTSVRELAGGVPTEFALGQNYPNPFNPTTTIRFALPEAATVQLEVYNMLGQRVATLVDGDHYTAGTYEAVWDATDEMGREMSSGMYIYRISAGNYVNMKKMLLMK